MILWLLSVLFLGFISSCTIDNSTVFDVALPTVPLIGDAAAITRVRQACKMDFVCNSKFQPHLLATNEKFMTLLQLAEPFPYPLNLYTPMYQTLNGFTHDEVNDKLWAMWMIYAVAEHTPCGPGSTFVLVNSNGDSACVSKSDPLDESVLSDNLIFYIVITLIVSLMGSYVIYLQLMLAKATSKYKFE
jgi:hypothetical protein